MLAFLRRLERLWTRRRASDGVDPESTGRAPVVVVTGGSEGIGKALAKEFARAGHDILLVARSEDALKDAAEEIRSSSDVTVHIAAIDLAKPDGCEKVANTLETLGLYADILINNAGIGLNGPFHEYEHDDMLRLIDLNIRALSELMHRFLPGMLRRARGGVMNVASLAGLLPGPYQAAYYASKAYVVSLTKAVAHEIAGRGVRICVLVPGPAATQFHDKMDARGSFYIPAFGLMSAEHVARAGYSGYVWGRTVIAPGLLFTLGALVIPIIPDVILSPVMAILLKPRKENSR